MSEVDQRLLRIGVFYDGNFFFHVSNFYRYAHSRRKRISIPGLHEFIRHHAAEVEGVDVRYSQIVDAHFFRGRLSAREADQRQKLFVERVFDDILMGEGVVTHYLPVRQRTEKGIDVWLALEAFELAVYKRFNVLVIIGGDADFIPLARKVNSLGTRMMVLGWDFKFTDDQGNERETTTSINLLDEVTYPVLMHQIIDDKTKRNDPLINGLFVPEQERAPNETRPAPGNGANGQDEQITTNVQGRVLSKKDSFGFLAAPGYPTNVFFSWQFLDGDLDDYAIGEEVVFDVIQSPRGPQARNVRKH